jgi:hypothetical protein
VVVGVDEAEEDVVVVVEVEVGLVVGVVGGDDNI